MGDPVLNSFVQWPTYGSTLYGMVRMASHTVSCVHSSAAERLFQGLVNLPQRDHIDSIMASGVQAIAKESCKAGYASAMPQIHKQTVFCFSVSLTSTRMRRFDFWNSVWNDNGEAPSPFYYQQYSGSNTTYEQLLTVDPPSQAWSGNWLGLPQVQTALHYYGVPNDQQNEGGQVYDTMVASGDFCQNSRYVKRAERAQEVVYVCVPH